MKKLFILIAISLYHLTVNSQAIYNPATSNAADSIKAVVNVGGTVRTIWNIDLGKNWQRKSVINVVSDYGADSTGVADASTAFTNAIAAANGKVVFVPAGTYLVTNVAMASDVYILGQGTKTVLKPSSGGSSKSVFTATNVSDWSIENIKFSGYNTHLASSTDSAITNSSIYGVKITGISQRWRIRSCNFYGFNGFGIYGTNSTTLVDSTMGGIVSNSMFRSNYGGTYFGEIFEYNAMSGNEFTSNVYGVWNVGGNNKYSTNTFKGNSTGFFLDSGFNDSHGSIIGNDFNHCLYGIRIGGITKGEVLSNNSFFTTSITATGSTGLSLTNNSLDITSGSIILTNTNGLNFSSNIINGNTGTPPTVTLSGNTNYSDLNNHYRSGAAFHLFNNGSLDIQGAVVITPSTGQSLTVTGATALNPTSGLNGLLVTQNSTTAGIKVTGGTNPYIDVTNGSVTSMYMTQTAAGLIGTLTAHPFDLYGGNTRIVRLFSGVARMAIGSTTDDAVNALQVTGNVKATQFRLSASSTAPSSASDTGTLGEIRITSAFIYYCTATNTWVRAALATW